MDRVAQIQERVRPGESIAELAARDPDAAYPVEIVRVSCRVLIEQTIATAQPVLAETSLLSESRGSLVAVGVVLVVLFVVVPRRVRTFLTLIPPAIAIAATTPHTLHIANLVGDDPSATSQLGGVAAPVLRHRVMLHPDAQLQGVTPDDRIADIVKAAPVPRVG